MTSSIPIPKRRAPRDVTPEARADLRHALRELKAINPPRLGRQLAREAADAFDLVRTRIAEGPLERQVHPDIPGVRTIPLGKFRYLVFYVVTDAGAVVIGVEYATSDYVERVRGRLGA